LVASDEPIENWNAFSLKRMFEEDIIVDSEDLNGLLAARACNPPGELPVGSILGQTIQLRSNLARNGGPDRFLDLRDLATRESDEAVILPDCRQHHSESGK